MRIKEVEEITGITSKNIRFYEKEGLLSPRRHLENRYRSYSDEDVNTLKMIKLFRKFGLSLSDIKDLQEGNQALSECLDKYVLYFDRQMKEMGKVINLCKELQKNEAQLQNLDVDLYLDKVNVTEKEGTRFIDIARDFKNKAKGIIPDQAKMFFEPEDPIMNPSEFVKELEKYAQRKDMSLTIIKLSMRPKILLDGKVYDCALEMPRTLQFPLSIFFSYRFNFGFRWVYLYEDFLFDI